MDADAVTRVELCGGLRLDGEPGRITGRLLVLLCVLALRAERGASRDELGELLWPARPPADPAKLLNPLLSRLRRSVGPVAGRGVVRFETPPAVDASAALGALDAAERLEADEPRGAAQAARTALEVLDRELLPGCEVAWVAEQRELLASRAIDAHALLARCALSGGPGERPAALAAARHVVAAEPLREDGVALLMEALSAAGRGAEALGAYEALRRTLRDELGTLPGRALRACHARVLAEQGAPARRPAGEETGRRPALPAALVRARTAPMVGRAAERAEIAIRLGAAARVVVIEGPAGIGKSRLAAEVAAGHHAAGGTVLHAHAATLAGTPFGPLAHALRPAGLTLDPTALSAALGPLAADLAGVVPALHRRLRLPALVAASGADPGARRLRLFEAVETLLDLLGRQGPVLLLIDDVDRLDSSSTELLGHLLRVEGEGAPVLLATARTRGGAAADVVGESAARVALGPLGPDELDAVVRLDRPDARAGEVAVATGPGAAGRSPTPLQARTALAAGGPGDLLDVVVRATGRLTPQTAELLDLAAACEGLVDREVLAAAAGVCADVVEDAVTEARSAGLLTPADALHDAIREALWGRLPQARRGALHARLATAYEAERDGDPTALPLLAAHWGAAPGRSAAGRAARFGEQAARRALAGLAFEQAAALARTARDAHERAGGDEEGRLALLLLEGEALAAGSALDGARAVLGEAIVAASELERPADVARAALATAGHRIGAGLHDPGLVAVLEAGLRAVAGVPDRLEHERLGALLRARLAGVLLDGPLERRDALAAEAERLARASADAEVLAEVLIAVHIGTVHRGDPRARGETVTEGRALALEAHRPDLALHTRMLAFSDALEAADVGEARATARHWAREADAGRAPYHRWAAAVALPTLDLLDGHPDRARTRLAEASRIAVPLGTDVVVQAAQGAMSLGIDLAVGEVAHVHATVSALVEALGRVPLGWTAALAYCEAILGRQADARRRVDAFVADGLARLVDGNRLAALSFVTTAAVVAGSPQPHLIALRDAQAAQERLLAVQHYASAVHGTVAARLTRLDCALGDVDAARRRVAVARGVLGASPPASLTLDLAVAEAHLARLDGASGAPAERGAARAAALGLHGIAWLIRDAAG